MSAGDVPSPSQPCTSFVDDYSDCCPRGSASKIISRAASRRNSRSPSPCSPTRARPLRSPQKSPPKSHWNPGGHPSCSPPPEPEAPDFDLIKWHKKGKGPPATRTVPLPPQPSRKFGQYDTNWEARYLSSHSWHRALHGGCTGPALPFSCKPGWSSYPATVPHHKCPSGSDSPQNSWASPLGNLAKPCSSKLRNTTLRIYLPPTNDCNDINGFPCKRPGMVKAPILPATKVCDEPPQAIAVTKMTALDPLESNLFAPDTLTLEPDSGAPNPNLAIPAVSEGDDERHCSAPASSTAENISSNIIRNFSGYFMGEKMPAFDPKSLVARSGRQGTSGSVENQKITQNPFMTHPTPYLEFVLFNTLPFLKDTEAWCQVERIMANHFKVKDGFKFDTIYVKTIKIEPKPQSTAVRRRLKSLLEEKLEKMYDRKFLLVFDGMETLYSNEAFPFQTQEGIVVEYGDPNRGDYPAISYKCTLSPKANLRKDGGLSGDGLKKYVSGTTDENIQEYVSALGHVMRENQYQNMDIMDVGPCSYAEKYGFTVINGFIVAWHGFFKSVRPTKQGLALNVDVSLCCFFKSQIGQENVPVLDFVKYKVRDYDSQFKFNPDSGFHQNLREYVAGLLRGTVVTMAYFGGGVTRRYKVDDLSKERTNQISFRSKPDGAEKKLVAYFKEKYNIDIKYKSLPCLALKSMKSTLHVPMELAFFVSGTKYNGKLSDKEMHLLKIASVRNPDQRYCSSSKLMEASYLYETLQEHRDPYCQAFRLAFHLNMTEITSRILKAPIIEYNSRPESDKMESHIDPGVSGCWAWGNRRALESAVMDWWGICDCSLVLEQKEKREFANELAIRARQMGLKMSSTCQSFFTCTEKMDPVQAIRAAYEEIDNAIPEQDRQNGHQVQLIIVFVRGKRSCCYNNIKYYGDVELGVPIQVVSDSTLRSHTGRTPGMRTSLTNLLMKINLKCGGRNHRLSYEQDHPARFASIGQKRTCVFFGADVSHPCSASDRGTPSIAAVVASNDWPDSGRFIARHRQQVHRLEVISDLQAIVVELLNEWKLANQNRLPDIIIFYRDGVGESQFTEILQKEVQAVKAAASQLQHSSSTSQPYCPLVTFVVVQKRHHTRLFRMSCKKIVQDPPELLYSQQQQQQQQQQRNTRTSTRNTQCRTMNVLPGTIVDDVICHPRDFDFYLCSHAGERGTSRPTHYHVLWDDLKFSVDDFENLTNKLCYIYARCTRAISMVAPAYYAHLVARRARIYYMAKKEMHCHTPGCQHRHPDGSGDHVKVPEVHSDMRSRMYFL